jgi:hypothetical protein
MNIPGYVLSADKRKRKGRDAALPIVLKLYRVSRLRRLKGTNIYGLLLE